MSMDYWVAESVYEMGSSDFMFSFFSTVLIRLEHGKWGSRFPVIMEQLYDGTVEPQQAASALKELAIIREELKAFSPTEVVWDSRDRTKSPPWGSAISPEITSLENYFLTSAGEPLLKVLDNMFTTSKEKGEPVINPEFRPSLPRRETVVEAWQEDEASLKTNFLIDAGVFPHNS